VPEITDPEKIRIFSGAKGSVLGSILLGDNISEGSSSEVAEYKISLAPQLQSTLSLNRPSVSSRCIRWASCSSLFRVWFGVKYSIRISALPRIMIKFALCVNLRKGEGLRGRRVTYPLI